MAVPGLRIIIKFHLRIAVQHLDQPAVRTPVGRLGQAAHGVERMGDRGVPLRHENRLPVCPKIIRTNQVCGAVIPVHPAMPASGAQDRAAVSRKDLLIQQHIVRNMALRLLGEHHIQRQVFQRGFPGQHFPARIDRHEHRAAFRPGQRFSLRVKVPLGNCDRLVFPFVIPENLRISAGRAGQAAGSVKIFR